MEYRYYMITVLHCQMLRDMPDLKWYNNYIVVVDPDVCVWDQILVAVKKVETQQKMKADRLHWTDLSCFLVSHIEISSDYVKTRSHRMPVIYPFNHQSQWAIRKNASAVETQSQPTQENSADQ